jgi:hypothetical protein
MAGNAVSFLWKTPPAAATAIVFGLPDRDNSD